MSTREIFILLKISCLITICLASGLSLVAHSEEGKEQSSLLRNISSQLKYQQEMLKKTAEEIAKAKVELINLQPRVQEGTINCFPYTYPTDNPQCLPPREVVHNVNFNRPYPKTPSVTLQLQLIDLDKTRNTRFYYYKQRVTPNGFQIVCATWCDTHAYQLKVDWQARSN